MSKAIESQSRKNASRLLKLIDNGHTTLQCKKFPYAVLRKRDLKNVDFRGTQLKSTFFSECDLTGSNFAHANLSRANLWDCNLRQANFPYADLSFSNLNGSNLMRTDLQNADLTSADLHYANLTGAMLHGTNLSKAKYSVLQMLQCDWTGFMGDKLRSMLMEIDASCWPDGQRHINTWAKRSDGRCPARKTHIYQAVLFNEDKTAWKTPHEPATLWEVWTKLADNFQITI